MPKQKTRKSVSKRFKVTGSGKLKRNKAGHSHMLIRRDKDVKRAAKKATVVAPSFEKRMKKMMAKAGRHRKIVKLAKGYFGARSRNFKAAKDAVTKAGLYAYRDRRQKKRQFRRLWIVRINAASRLNGLSYSNFVHLLKEKGVDLDRKVLADLAVNNPTVFEDLVKYLKKI